jgi:hypothetical protein
MTFLTKKTYRTKKNPYRVGDILVDDDNIKIKLIHFVGGEWKVNYIGSDFCINLSYEKLFKEGFKLYKMITVLSQPIYQSNKNLFDKCILKIKNKIGAKNVYAECSRSFSGSYYIYTFLVTDKKYVNQIVALFDLKLNELGEKIS